LATIETLLNRHGLALFDAYLSPIHGGSMIGFITHQSKNARPSERLQKLRQQEAAEKSNELATYLKFAERIKQMKVENLAYLAETKKKGKRIFGMGAPVKGNTLLNYFGIGRQYLDEKELTQLPDTYYVLAWNFKKEILANNQELIRKGVEFYFPVEPKEISA
jgi:hypothetical protein